MRDEPARPPTGGKFNRRLLVTWIILILMVVVVAFWLPLVRTFFVWGQLWAYRASTAKAETIGREVRAHHEKNGSCPSWDEVENFSMILTGHGLCPGGEVPDERPCVGYQAIPTVPENCGLDYHVGLDGFRLYLSIQDIWLDQDDVYGGALQELGYRAPAPRDRPPDADDGQTDGGPDEGSRGEGREAEGE